MLRIERLATAEGEPLPEEDWPNVPGVRVRVVKEWIHPEAEYDDTDEDGASEQDDEEYEPAEPHQHFVPAWVITTSTRPASDVGQIGASGTGSTRDDGGARDGPRPAARSAGA